MLWSGSSPLTAKRGVMWGLLMVSGVAWLAVAWSVLRLDPIDVGYVAGPVVLFGAVTEALRALAGRSTWWLNAGMAVLFAATGVILMSEQDSTYTTPAALVGWYLLVRGVADVAIAAMTRETDRIWGLLMVVGVLEVGLGFFAASPLSRTADLVVVVLGGLGVLRAVADLTTALRLREAQIRAELLHLPPEREAGVAGYSAGLTDYETAPRRRSRHRASGGLAALSIPVGQRPDADADAGAGAGAEAGTGPDTPAGQGPGGRTRTGPDNRAGTEPGTRAEVGPHTRGEAGPHTRGDAGPHTRGDAGPHTRGDAGPHTRTDAGPHTRADAGPHTRTDTGPHTRADTGPHTRADTGPHTRADTGPHTRGEAGPDDRGETGPGNPAGRKPSPAGGRHAGATGLPHTGTTSGMNRRTSAAPDPDTSMWPSAHTPAADLPTAGGAAAAGGMAATPGYTPVAGNSFHDEVLRTTADLDAMLALAGVTGAGVGARVPDYETPEVPDTPEGVAGTAEETADQDDAPTRRSNPS